MKTINLSIPEETWRLARIEAARHSTSLSGMVRRYLNAVVRGKVGVIPDDMEDDADCVQREKLASALSDCNLVLGYQPSRTKTYER